MARSFTFWFDFTCPYAYLASKEVEAVAARTGARLELRPMLLGGVFAARATPQRLFETFHPPRLLHQANDLRRLAQLAGVPLTTPAGHPIRSVDALRVLLAAGEPFGPLMHRFFCAYWAENLDLSDRAVLGRLVTELGHDAGALLERAGSPEVRDELRRRTDEACALGIFGAPSFVVDGALYFGQDRLALVERALGGAGALPEAPRGPLSPVDFYFDYSSPYAYLASERVEAVLGDAARWRPMLLGGLFKQLGTPSVPFFAQGEAKQQHTVVDLFRQAERAGAPFAWPSRFPIGSILALRVTLAARAAETREGRALVHRLFRAFWAEDQDLADPAVVRALCDEVGLDGRELVERASAPEAKAALFAATEHAFGEGVFGAPTFVVHLPEGRRALYWGSDRLDLAARAAAGDPRAV
jgi:2-hydroxychromene-2-carboxylate isomerase